METPGLFVPDLTPAPAGVVDRRGQVGCVVCGRRFPLADVDVVGLGFRCRACSLRAALDGTDEAAHLRPEERARIRREPPPRAYAVAGLVCLAAAATLWAIGWDLRLGRRGSLFTWLFITGVGLAGVGWFRWLDGRRRPLKGA